jgi:hypothetical protein
MWGGDISEQGCCDEKWFISRYILQIHVGYRIQKKESWQG